MRALTIISLILFGSLFLGSSSVSSNGTILRSDAPNRYQVMPGDTLWGIASRFLREPWRWPEIWQMNRYQVKNPHRIYPGDIITVANTQYGKRLSLSGETGTVRLSPRIRTEAPSARAIPSIAAEKIEPFLSQPLIIEKEKLKRAPVILGVSDDRVILSAGDKIYIHNLPVDHGTYWQIFRSGKALTDPDHDDNLLGYEATYLGTVEIVDFAEVSTAVISHSVQEILKGDRLLPLESTDIDDYLPHAPDFFTQGRIVSVYGGVNEIGENMIVALNLGESNGVEPGHVLAIYREHGTRSHESKLVNFPDERIGLAMVFRTFDTVSYALIMQSVQTIKVTDVVKTP